VAAGEFVVWLRVVESNERLIEIRLGEHFTSADAVTVKGENADLAPFGLEAFARRRAHDMRDDGTQVAQPVHRLDVNCCLWHQVP